MNYITNKDHISTTSLYDPNYLSHGLSWGSHRYIKREGTPGHYTYTYPEDLRNAGQKLVTGAKSLVTRAGNAVQNASRAVGRATGVSQRQAYNRAKAETNKWVSRTENAGERVRNVTTNKSRQFHSWQGYFAQNLGADPQRPVDYAGKNLNRAVENENRARSEYQKTALGKLEKLGNSIKDLPSDVSYEVENFMRSKIGVGGRKRIDETSGKYDSAWRKLEQSEFNYYHNRGTSAEGELLNKYLSDRSNLDDSYSDYRNAVEDYGKTFLGSVEKLLSTSYSKMVFINHTPENYSDVIPETILKETIIPEQRIPETIIPEQRIPETIIPEQRIPDKRKPHKRDENIVP